MSVFIGGGHDNGTVLLVRGAAGLKYSSAAAATVAKFTVPAFVHKKRVSAPSKMPAGAIRQPPPGA
jgi:hypothetical protein